MQIASHSPFQPSRKRHFGSMRFGSQYKLDVSTLRATRLSKSAHRRGGWALGSKRYPAAGYPTNSPHLDQTKRRVS